MSRSLLLTLLAAALAPLGALGEVSSGEGGALLESGAPWAERAATTTFSPGPDGAPDLQGSGGGPTGAGAPGRSSDPRLRPQHGAGALSSPAGARVALHLSRCGHLSGRLDLPPPLRAVAPASRAPRR